MKEGGSCSRFSIPWNVLLLLKEFYCKIKTEPWGEQYLGFFCHFLVFIYLLSLGSVILSLVFPSLLLRGHETLQKLLNNTSLERNHTLSKILQAFQWVHLLGRAYDPITAGYYSLCCLKWVCKCTPVVPNAVWLPATAGYGTSILLLSQQDMLALI